MVKPQGSRIYAELIEAPREFKTSSGLILGGGVVAPESVLAKVLVMGPTASEFTEASVGDTIAVAQFSPTKLQEKPTDKTFIIPAEDVLAVITNDSE